MRPQKVILIMIGALIVLIAMTAILTRQQPANELNKEEPNQNIITAIDEDDFLSLDLKPINGSSISGTVKVEPFEGTRTLVSITLNNSAEASQPATLNRGNCDNIGNQVGMLTSLKKGSSETIKDALYSDFFVQPVVVVVRESFSNVAKRVACAEIKKS